MRRGRPAHWDHVVTLPEALESLQRAEARLAMVENDLQRIHTVEWIVARLFVSGWREHVERLMRKPGAQAA